jgi:hypothetical protein
MNHIHTPILVHSKYTSHIFFILRVLLSFIKVRKKEVYETEVKISLLPMNIRHSFH